MKRFNSHRVSGILLAILSFTCSGHALAQQFSFNQGGTTSQHYFVELPYQNINGKIITEIGLGGKKRRFLFDTGAITAISKALTDELKPKFLHRGRITDINSNADSLDFVALNNIQLGTISFSGVPAVSGIGMFYECLNVQGVIGSNLFRNSIVRIDDLKKVIQVTDDAEKLSLNPEVSTRMALDSGHTAQSMPLIAIAIDDKVKLWLEFDTGDNDLIRLADRTMKALQPYNSYRLLAKGYGANSIGLYGLEAAAEKFLLQLNSIRVGKTRFDQVTTIPIKNGDPAIGSGILKYGIVTLDYIHRRFYFRSDKPLINCFEPQWPFQPTVDGTKLIVSLVWDNGAQLVKPGEQIVAIDGQDYSTVDLCELMIRPSILAGKTSAILQVKNSMGETRKVEIKKK